MTCHCVRAGRRCRLFSWPKDLWETNTSMLTLFQSHWWSDLGDLVGLSRSPQGAGGNLSGEGGGEESKNVMRDKPNHQILLGTINMLNTTFFLFTLQTATPQPCISISQSGRSSILWKLAMVSFNSSG